MLLFSSPLSREATAASFILLITLTALLSTSCILALPFTVLFTLCLCYSVFSKAYLHLSFNPPSHSVRHAWLLLPLENEETEAQRGKILLRGSQLGAGLGRGLSISKRHPLCSLWRCHRAFSAPSAPPVLHPSVALPLPASLLCAGRGSFSFPVDAPLLFWLLPVELMKYGFKCISFSFNLPSLLSFYIVS